VSRGMGTINGGLTQELRCPQGRPPSQSEVGGLKPPAPLRLLVNGCLGQAIIAEQRIHDPSEAE
jgi:hypothetical protein